MPQTTPKMGLRAWTLLPDRYDHTQLAQNLAKIDLHDHTPGRGAQIPTAGIQDGAITAPKLAPGSNQVPDAAIGTAKLANGAVTLPKLGPDVTTDYGYSFLTYRTLVRRASKLAGGIASATYVLINSIPASGGATALTSDVSVVADSDLFWLDPADYTAGSRSTKYRVRGICVTNAVAPTGTFTIGLYPVTLTYGASGVGSAFTLGPVTSGSTVAFVTPGASGTAGPTLTSDFPAPAAGWYTLAVNNSATTAANSNTELYAELQMHQV